ncbi:uncharacterized protein RCC_05280 [Ramularia collo-cygni]|uniref:Uncharacterized protein n=1 Tax=Ramularia collo-cygni TaxID=112498 RepID=A0A2D3VCR9_9PEZI|nr:uncharacterized protein RCC_05280 [Ramularia collo-cygni]CZT19429.1 uncharacterized protein RCC_05280 [Ramularia collo-cygni]
MQRLALRLRSSPLPRPQPPTYSHTLRSIPPSTTPRLIPRTHHRRISYRQPHSQQHHEPIPFQPVRFQKPGIFTRKRQMTLALYIFACMVLFKQMSQYVTIDVEVQDADRDKEEKKDGGAKGVLSDEDDDDEEYTFIPLTWGKKLPREFYRGSDPEWQEFVKVAKDKPRHKKIQDALVQQVFAGSQKHPGVVQHLGKDLKVGKYWLDISFPDGPPQEYERYGLEIGESAIHWSAERITPEEQFRLQRALWPAAVFRATWAASKAVAGIQYRRIKQSLGVEGVDPFSPEERLRLALEVAEQQQAAKNQKGRRGSGDIDPAGAVVSRSSPTDTAEASDEAKKRFPWQIQVPMPSFDNTRGQSMDLPIFSIVFQTTLNKHWAPKKMEPPRGSFVVQGMMEVRGSKGQILFDVRGCYDPKEAKFVMVQANKRGFKLWNQRPKGGP